MLRTLNEQVKCSSHEDDDLEEASNSTDAYAGGEGPQRTPHAFGGTTRQKRRKFGTPASAYQDSPDETDVWFKNMESAVARIDSILTEDDFVSALDTRQLRRLVSTTLKEFGLAIFSTSSKKQTGSSRVGIKFIIYNPHGKYMDGDTLQTASDKIDVITSSYSNISSVNLRYGRTANGFYPYIIIYLRRIGRTESIIREDGNATTALDGGGLSTGAQISNPKAFSNPMRRSKDDKEKLDAYDGIEFEEEYDDLHFESIHEISYNDYVSDTSSTDKEKINRTIQEINTKLREIEQLIKHSQKFKNEIGADSKVFYKDTINRFGKISERLKVLQAKIREFNL